ncbi:MAG: thymidine phosphorylase, thymidine phosphorylase [Candidatus Peregrinibacteria bacterium GW2011_GWF2_38_29]|nr:MAG: thymidine phosphorylase, thymidine phosphorylase [Candidatus Peregrinibacteria bacterium GW2011_GWF2_38_29]HBB02807.1 AMP phosphorylase [Candidatus Peregrinibacteria bacterium]
MKLTPKKIPIKVGSKFIAILNEKTSHKLDLFAGDRIAIFNDGKGKLTAILDITEGKDVKDDQIGLYMESWEKLNVKKGDVITVSIAEKPKSTLYIKEKLEGVELSTEKIDAIINDVVNDDLSEVELAYFVAGAYTKGLSDKETIALTRSIVNHGNTLSFKKGEIIADKHCIGGVPGNRTTMISIPIVACLGIKIPKTSSRAITSPSGTADTMEVLANVENDAKRLMQIVNKVGACITWGGGVDIAAADDKMIRVRHPLSLDPKGMLLASIMAKKFAVGAKYVLIDIPFGQGVKVSNQKQADDLKKDFERIGSLLGMKTKVITTDGSQPIGKGIGPVLEVIDVMKVLKNEPEAPYDLRTKALMMAGLTLEFTGKAKKGQGEKMAEEVLTSGKAYKKFMEIIEAQGKKHTKLEPGAYKFHVVSPCTGDVFSIANKQIAHIARIAGAPKDPSAGVYLYKKVGDRVLKNEPLYTIYAENEDRLNYAKKYLTDIGYDIR